MKYKKLTYADISAMFKRPKKNPCPGEDSIASLADGTADKTEERGILRHCSICQPCRELLADLKMLYTAAPREPSPAFKRRIDAIMESKQTAAVDLVISLAKYGIDVVRSVLRPAPLAQIALRDRGGTSSVRSFRTRALRANWNLEFHRNRGRMVDLLVSAEPAPKQPASVALYAGIRMVKSFSYSGKALSFNNLKPGRYRLHWQGATAKNINFLIEG
jgi:hypothetical protein